MNAHLEVARLTDLVSEVFHVGTPPYALTAPLTLVSATEKPAPAGDIVTLSLVFRGPEQPFVPQGTYILMHKAMAPQTLFIVPISKTADGYHYEILINHVPPGQSVGNQMEENHG